ncbi:MAG TPA: hypothetical protein VFV10_17305 [Gammaproteobacteria bacterium]|nr:hypothetical protein [Gammaproteobacteria bacterium]
MSALDEQAGSDVLRSIDRGIDQLRGDMRTTDEAVQSASQQLLRLAEAELSSYKRLAEIRLEQLTRGGVVTSLDAVSQRVRDILAQRETALAELTKQVAAAEQRLAALETERDQQRTRVAAASAQLDEREAAVQSRLASDAAYQAQLEKARAADATADEAEQKTERAEKDRTEKGTPYEADPLFMYLWKRGYGTSEYSANFVARLLDRRVARLCRYDKARPNYWMLQEIPVRLRAHAERVRAAATHEFEALKTLEHEAAEQDGVPPLEQALEKERAAQKSIDESIESLEKSHADLLKQRSAFASGEDAQMQEALSALAGELRGAGVEALRRAAAATENEEDDRLVARIVEYEHARARLEDALRQNKAIHARNIERVQTLEDVRRKFKQADYDDMRSVFANHALLALAIANFLRGMASGDDLWSAIRTHQRFRRVASYPDFGSGGFPGRIGTWRTPGSMGGWNLPRAPRGGGFGGGGFKTGGGFGGGGRFKTGGGF